MENRATLRAISDMFADPKIIRNSDDKPKFAFKPRQPKPVAKTGGLCPTCRTSKSVTGICFCNS